MNYKKKKLNVNFSNPYKSQYYSMIEAPAKATNHYAYQMSPKFLINVIFCAQSSDSMR